MRGRWLESGEKMNTADYLLANGRDPDAALITRKSAYSYAQLREACACLAHALREAGVAPGDRVGLLGENTPFWVAAYLATMKIGAISVPLPTQDTPEEVQQKIGFVGGEVVCVERRLLRKFAAAFEEPILQITDQLLEDPRETWWEAAAWDETELDKDAALMLTSGTTARPRAVRVTHRNIQANTDSIIAYLELDADERIMAILPFYYCFGTSLLHTHLRVGGSLVASTMTYPEVVLNQIEEDRCSGLAGVPSTYQSLLRNSTLKKRALPSLKKVQQAGGKLQNVLIAELADALPYAQIYVMYGQTEATARLSYLPPELLDAKMGSIGKGIPGVQLRVVDENGEQVAPGQVGEIYAQGDNISPGYFEDPQDSREKFQDGVLHTGDLATVDDEGFIYVVDRKSDFIKSYGHRVSSQQIEACVLELPEVVAAAAIGVPDLVSGEAIRVFVVPQSKAELNAETVIAHCQQRLAHHMIPKEVVFLKSLPMNAHGKVVKALLREAQASDDPT